MRMLGIDYGGKRVGIAVSDEVLVFAYPEAVLDNGVDLMRKIKEICGKKDVKEIVIGESLDFSGKPNTIMSEIVPFAEELNRELELPVHFHPEFMTSQAAERFQGKNEMHDASAAALILQSFLDTKNNRNSSKK